MGRTIFLRALTPGLSLNLISTWSTHLHTDNYGGQITQLPVVGLPVVYFDLTPVKSCSQLPNKKRAEETTVILSRHGSATALVRSAVERLSPESTERGDTYLTSVTILVYLDTSSLLTVPPIHNTFGVTPLTLIRNYGRIMSISPARGRPSKGEKAKRGKEKFRGD